MLIIPISIYDIINYNGIFKLLGVFLCCTLEGAYIYSWNVAIYSLTFFLTDEFLLCFKSAILKRFGLMTLLHT